MRLGLLGTNTAAVNNDTSRDASIAGSSRNSAWLATLDGGLKWAEGQEEVEHLFKARYGRIKQNGEAWTENTDEVRYDGVFRHLLGKPHFIYLSWGAESVFTGRAPEKRGFDPVLAKAAVGYGQHYDDLLTVTAEDKDKLEMRVGVRAQHRWGTYLSPEDRKWQVGLEGFLRYDRSVGKNVTAFVQDEVFAPFNDMAHLTNLTTAGLAVSLAQIAGGADLRVELALRAFYETRPKSADDNQSTGYHVWSMRQDTMLGLTWAL